MLFEIKAAIANPDHTVAITWSDGIKGVVSFESYIAKGGLFSALKDADYFVNEMRIMEDGIGLTWPHDVDFSSDGLRHDAFPKEESGEFEESVSLPNAKSKSPEQPRDRSR